MRDDDPYSDDGEDLGPSRSQRKRDAAELKSLGDDLVALPESDLEALPLEEKLRDAIDLARRITAHGAAARQRQLIGKILRKTDVGVIREAIAKRDLERRLAAREFHRVESWRNRLVAEGDSAVSALLAVAPELDAPELRRRVDAARAEAAAGRPPAEARELFRWLRENLAAQGGSA